MIDLSISLHHAWARDPRLHNAPIARWLLSNLYSFSKNNRNSFLPVASDSSSSSEKDHFLSLRSVGVSTLQWVGISQSLIYEIFHMWNKLRLMNHLLIFQGIITGIDCFEMYLSPDVRVIGYRVLIKES